MDRIYPEIPDFIRKMMQSGEELDEIKIDSEGRWLHNGTLFRNKKIISYFNKSLDVTKDGYYVINYGGFVYPVIVEDAPFFVTGIKFMKSDNDKEDVYIALSTGVVEKLDLNTLHYKNNALYCFVKNGEMPAKFKRSPSYEMLQNIKDNDDVYYLEICGKKIVLSEKVDITDI